MSQQQAGNKATGAISIIVLIGCFWLCGGCFGVPVGPFAHKSSSEKPPAPVVDKVRGVKPVEGAWDALTPEVNTYLKGTLKDYGSLEIVECSQVIEWQADRWAQRVKYRAKNSFGAKELVQTIFIIKDGKVTGTSPLS